MHAIRYRELILSVVNSCRYIEEQPHVPGQIQIPQANPNALIYVDDIDLFDDLRLTVREQAFFDEDGLAERSFAYNLRRRGTGRMIWRICNHYIKQSVENPCHVHVDPDDEEERIEFFPNSRTTTFPYAMQCIRKHFEHVAQEWEK